MNLLGFILVFMFESFHPLLLAKQKQIVNLMEATFTNGVLHRRAIDEKLVIKFGLFV